MNCNHNPKQPFTTFASCEFDSIDRIITRGGHADLVCGVLKVIHPRKKISSPTVAVKAFRRVGPAQDQLNIENELEIWRLLCAHPQIASFIGIAPVDSYDPRYFAQGPVSDYYVHGDLNMYLYKVDPDVTNHKMRFQLLLGVIRGLAYVHTQSIVHGDLKAGNVLIDGDQQVLRICDFGTARIDCGCYSGPKEQEGTLAWDSPELWLQEENDQEDEDDDDDEEEAEELRPRTKRSDVWAFGCVALEVQMGTTPWDPKHEGNLRAMRMRQFKAKTEYPVKESDLDLDLNQHPIITQVWSMIERCWNADPFQRPTAAVLWNDCEALAAALSTE